MTPTLRQLLFLAMLLTFTTAASAATLGERALGTKVLGLGAAVMNLDANGIRDMVLAWVDGSAADPRARYAFAFDLAENGSCARLGAVQDMGPVAAGPVVGAGLAVAFLDGKRLPDLVFATLHDGPSRATLRYRLGFNCSAAKAPVWGKELAVPLHPAAKAHGLGATLHDVNRNGTNDLILAWAEPAASGFVARTVVAFDLSPLGVPKSWGMVRPVVDRKGAVLTMAEVHGLDLVAAVFDTSYRSDLVLAWVEGTGDGKRMKYTAAMNLDDGGKAERWTDVRTLDVACPATTALALAAGRIDAQSQLDLAFLRAEKASKDLRAKLTLVLNPAFVPPYVPNEADLAAKGDPTSGLSRAVVKTLISRGMYSPYQLIRRIDPMVKGVKKRDELTAAILAGLDAISPAIDDAVKGELEAYLYKYYGVAEADF